jgi:hypothetical protein
VTPGTLLLEAQTQPGQTAAQWFGNRCLDAYALEGSTAATLSPGQFRFNNVGPAGASVTISGPM